MKIPQVPSAPQSRVKLILLSLFIFYFSPPATAISYIAFALHLILSISRLFIYDSVILNCIACGCRKDVSLRQKLHCKTTVQGRYHLTDDNGYVCDTFSADPLSHCCPGRGDQFSCQGCNIVSRCCNSYEFCVSCCLNPEMSQKELASKVKIAKPVTDGIYGSTFDYCAGRCRHNSESVVHENAYMSVYHHCFSIPSNSSVFEQKVMVYDNTAAPLATV